VVVVSYFGNKVVPLILAPDFHDKRVRLISSQVSNLGSGLQPRWDARRRMAYAMEDLARIDVGRLVTHRMPFDAAADAYHLLDTRPQETMSIVLEYTPSGSGS